MKRILPMLVLLAASAFAQVQPTFFGMHILEAPQGATPWPNVQFGTVRIWNAQADWKTINTANGVYNWSMFDSWMNLAQQHNVDLLYTFGRVPSWANGGQSDTHPPTNMTYWDNFVTAVVNRAAGRVKYWELWNEPNDTHYWYNENDVSTLITMAQHAYKIIKSIDPNAQVLTPSSTWTDTTPWGWTNSYLRAGGGQYADIIAFHGYVTDIPEDFNGLAQQMWSVMNANGQGSKALWDTENSFGLQYGCGNFCDPNLQAGFVVRSYFLHLSNNVARFFWYAWDEDWGPLWDPTNGPHLAAAAYEQTYKWLVGATLTQKCSADSNSTWTCGISRPGYQGLAVWNNNSTTYTTPSQYRQYRDLSGNTHSVPTNGIVNVGYQPILLETTVPSGGSCSSSLKVSMTSPSSGATLASPIHVTGTATSGCSISDMRIYVDGSAVYDTASGTTDTYITLAPGSHNVTLQAWDSSQAVAKVPAYITVTTASSSCTMSSQNRSVTICTPGANATVSSPVHVVAGTTDSTRVTAMRIYVDSQGVYTVNASKLDTSVSLSSGSHYLVVQAWDANGSVFKTGFNINVN